MSDTDEIRVFAYTELLPPAAWNSYKGGRVWEWMQERGHDISCHQQDPGPAYGVFYTSQGRHRVDIHQTIRRTELDGVVTWGVTA